MLRSGLALVLSIACCASAAAQDAAPTDDPAASVCLTNACSAPLAKGGKPGTIAAAIDAGDVGAVMALGGSPQDLMAADAARIARQQGADSWGAVDARRFLDTSDGSVLRFSNRPIPPLFPGQIPVGMVERQSPDGYVEVRFVAR